MKKLFAVLLVITMIGLFSISSFGVTAGDDSDKSEVGYGSLGALLASNYTLKDMLTYAIQDEYLAIAEYEKIMKKFNVQRPFSNIANSEKTHISLLKPLFEAYNIPVPEDTSSEHVIVPDTQLAAYKAGVQAEINNIAMYTAFLKQDLPDDVKSVFLRLESASQNHLKSFENGVAKLEGTSASSTIGTSRRGYGWQR